MTGIEVMDDASLETAQRLGDDGTQLTVDVTRAITSLLATELEKRLRRTGYLDKPRHKMSLRTYYGVMYWAYKDRYYGLGRLNVKGYQQPPEPTDICESGAGGFEIVSQTNVVLLAGCIQVEGPTIKVTAGFTPLCFTNEWPSADRWGFALPLDDHLAGGSNAQRALEPLYEHARIAVTSWHQGYIESMGPELRELWWKTLMATNEPIPPVVQERPTSPAEEASRLAALVSQVACSKCGTALTVSTEDAYVACEQCDSLRCPLCGGLLGYSCSWSGDAPSNMVEGADTWCRSCRIMEFSSDGSMWRPETLIHARFRRVFDGYAASHPSTNLPAVSRFLCSKIATARNGGRLPDLFLLALHFSETTDSVIWPWGGGWNLEREDRSIRIGPRWQVDFATRRPDGAWLIEERQAELEEPYMVEHMQDWLDGERETHDE